MRITMVGAGYVGLVTGSCFAETGHDVTIIEKDQNKLSMLHRGEVPFYEPGLKDLLERNIREKRLSFSDKLATVLGESKVVFIAVGTPQGEDGSADLSHVLHVAEEIGRAMTKPLVVVTKSTVPVGTAKKVREIIAQHTHVPCTVASNPEFLKEGAAVTDFLHPDRVVIGTEDDETKRMLFDLYAPFVRTGNPILFMDCASAELTKYAANCLLASRISFMNELSILCDALGADVEMIRYGIGSDKRIGHSFLFPGPGYGGSCFPKDVRALLHCGQEYGVDLHLVEATDRANERQKHLLTEKIRARFGVNLEAKTFAVWGLSFKPRTDDIRESPALTLIDDLLAAGARVRAYDPEAMKNAEALLGDKVMFCADGYACCQGADALVVVTEWNAFRRPDFERLKALMKQAVVFDGRNLYDPQRMRSSGFEHIAIGRSGVCQ